MGKLIPFPQGRRARRRARKRNSAPAEPTLVVFDQAKPYSDPTVKPIVCTPGMSVTMTWPWGVWPPPNGDDLSAPTTC